MQASALEFAGLYTFPNPLSKVPVGAMLQADNLTGNQDGTATCRRGVEGAGDFVDSDSPIEQFFAYQNRLLLNGAMGDLWYDSSGNLSWVEFSGTYIKPSNAEKMRGVEANKNFFITTNNGVQKLAAYNATPIPAGVPPGLDGTAALSGDGSGLLGSNKQAAYQIVFGYNDANGNLLLGSPSERILIVNSGGGSDNVDLTFTVPQGLTTSYFYQIYRTPQTTYSATPALNIPPGAEPQLATQQALTSGQIAAFSVTYTDVTPDALLDTPLYTNPSQQGALQPNDRPPLATDMCVFSEMMFYANCQTLENMSFNLISVGSPNGIQNDDTIVINGVTFTGKSSQNNASKEFKVDASGTVSENIDNTARNLIQCINANAADTDVYAIYLSGFNDLPGLIELIAVDFTITTFVVTSSRGGAFSPVIPSSGTTFASTNDSTPNGIYVSKPGQPEAVPSVNLVFVGGGDQPILRILPLRDRVIVLKTDGVFVITGTTPSTLSITLLDSTIICIAAESAKLLNNSVYCMTNQAVVSITESGVTLQSRAIELDLIRLTSPSLNTPYSFSSRCNAIPYESERLYILNLPTTIEFQSSSQAYCYNWVTNVWTRWDLDMQAGIINPFDNKLYCSRPDTDASQIFRERKNYLYTDFMDAEHLTSIAGVDATGLIVTLNEVPNSNWIGWGLVQTIDSTQYIAIITDVATGPQTVTVSLTNSTTPGYVIPWEVDNATIEEPIDIALVHAPITAGFPHYLKDWTRWNFWFNGGNFPIISAGFITDVQGSTQYLATILTGGYGFQPFGPGPYGGQANYPQSIQTLVPTDVAKARWIQPTLALSFPQSVFNYLGSTGSFENISDVSG